jgi:hypothetical protein
MLVVRRVLHVALNAATGESVQLFRERSRQDDCPAFVEALGAIRLNMPKLLVWDNAPRAHLTSAWLPVRAPKMNPVDRWRLLKTVVAANHAASSMDDLAQQAVA